MGACVSRKSSVSYAYEEDPNTILIQKMKQLEEKISEVMKQREEDNEAFEGEMMMFALKEAKWRKEKKRLKDETKRIRRMLDNEREDRIRIMMKGESENSTSISSTSISTSTSSVNNNNSVNNNIVNNNSVSVISEGSMMLVEQMMREERARRDATVEKWKMLYLAIKTELDHLIQRTHQGALYWREEDEEEVEESLVEELQQELKVKNETIKFLKAQIDSMINEEKKRKREVDILRQSLKILSSKKGSLQHLLSTPL